MRENILLIRYTTGKPDQAIVLTGEFRQEGKRWLAECVETGTATYAATMAQARAELSDAITLQFDEIEKLGFVEQYLQDHRIRPQNIAPTSQRKSGRRPTWAIPQEASKTLTPA